jgi:hypothetical protein
MVAVAISSVVVLIIGAAIQNTNLGLAQQLDNSQALQNGNVAIEVLQYYLRKTAFGFEAGTTQTGSSFPIGQCKHTDGSVDASCNNQDSGSDRLRILAADTIGYSYPSSTFDLANSTLTLGTTGMSAVPSGHPWASGTEVIVSGTCDSGAAIFAQIVAIAAPVPTEPLANPISYTIASSSLSPGTVCVSTNTDVTVAVKGVDSVIDFYVSKPTSSTDSTPPALMMDRNDGTGAFAVAFDVEDLQVRYGIDRNNNEFVNSDEWCNDITNTSTAECGTLAGLSLQQKLSRILGIQVAIVSRTPGQRAAHSYAVTAFDNTISGNDKHRRWIHRATVALRNR